MVETTMTAGLMSQAGEWVGAFDSLLLFVLAMGMGVFVVSLVLRKVRAARRG